MCRYVPSGKKDVRTIPLEIFVKGDKEPLYGSTTEDDLRGYAATVLPFQAYGALGMNKATRERLLHPHVFPYPISDALSVTFRETCFQIFARLNMS